jgi:hypothetical protein
MSVRRCVVVAIEVDCTGEPARTSPFIEETVIHGKGAVRRGDRG